MPALETVLPYLLTFVTENPEVKKFPQDFVTASMRWIRSWFLTDDPVTSSIVENPALPEAVKKPVLEAKLNVLKDNPTFVQELAVQLQAFHEQQKARLKNVVDDAEIEVKGNVHIGDKGTSSGEHYDQKNIVKGGTIKAGGDFRLGDDLVAGENVQIVHNYYGLTAKPGEAGKPSPLSLKAELQKLIVQEQIAEAIDRFLEVAEAQDLEVKNELLQLYARFNRISKSDRLNVASTAEVNLERNKINAALVELIKQLA